MKASVSMYCVPVLLKYSTGTMAAGSASPPTLMLSMDALRFQEVLSNGTSPPFWSITSYA